MTDDGKKKLKVEVGISEPLLDSGGHMGGGAARLLQNAVEQLTYVDIDALVASISVTIEDLTEAFRPKPGGPESCEVKFGFKVGGSGDIILAKIDSEVNIEVKLTWKREEHKA